MTRSRISMVVAAAGLVLVGLLAAALFSPSDDEPTDETTAKEEEKIEPVKPKTAELTPKLYETDTPEISFEPEPEVKTEPEPEVKEEPKVEPEPAPKKGGIIEYTIQPGDMISKLAVKYGCKSTDIYKANEGITKDNAHKIRVGQTIKIPVNGEGVETVSSGGSKASSGDYYPQRTVTAEPGDTAFSLAIEYYGARAMFRKIVDANPSLPWSERLTGGEQVVLPEYGTPSGEQVENTRTEKTEERNSLIPPRR